MKQGANKRLFLFMARFWIDRSCLRDNEFLIKDSLYHHICRVCQIKKGEIFELFCEGFQKYKVALSSVSSSKAVAVILEAYPVPPLKKPYLHLALSVPRFSKIDTLIEKAVELGVKEFHPFISTFSFLKKPSQLSIKRKTRWKKIAEQSLALSGRTEAMLLHPLQSLQEIKIPKEDLAFMAYEGESQGIPLIQLIKKKTKANAIWLFIGSEGGFSSKEAKEFASRENAFVFSMGEQILKVETACLFGLSILKYHYHL